MGEILTSKAVSKVRELERKSELLEFNRQKILQYLKDKKPIPYWLVVEKGRLEGNYIPVYIKPIINTKKKVVRPSVKKKHLDMDLVLNLRQEGKIWKEIAEQIGYSKSHVEKMFKKHFSNKRYDGGSC